MDKRERYIMLKEKISSMKWMQGILHQYRMKKMPEYAQWHEDFFQCHSMFKFQQFGELHRDRNIYYMKFDDPTWGFFAAWKFGLAGLSSAERYGFTPVIDWTEKSPYFEPGGVKGIRNPFEYYFTPVSDVTAEEAGRGYNVSLYNNRNRGVLDTKYNADAALDEYVRLNRKYIHIRDDIYGELEHEINGMLNGRQTVGVHVRGVEWGNIRNHPIPVGLEEYSSKAEEAIKKFGFQQIFLATDSEDTVSYFRDRYKDHVVFYPDNTRTKKGGKTLAIFDEEEKRRKNGYILGYEVLRDMLTLSFCDGMIAGYSNVRFAAEVYKKGRNEKYIYRHLMEQNICKTGLSVRQAFM